MKNLITIIVPVYKIKENFLRKCIESILHQEGEDYSIVLIDDGSPDNCGEICDEYAAKNTKVRVVHQKNQGVSVARNRGIQEANTPWIVFVDPDDWVESTLIKNITVAINGYPEKVDIVFFDYWRESNDSVTLEAFGGVNEMLGEASLEECRLAPFYKLMQNEKLNSYEISAVWNKVYRREFLVENGLSFLPEAKKGQDRLFNAAALLKVKAVFYLHQAFYHYRCYKDSITNCYNPNILNYTIIELNELSRLKSFFSKSEDIELYLSARICTRLYSCMRLFLFHSNQNQPYRKQLAMLKELIAQEPFSAALQMVDFSLLTTQEKIFVAALKIHQYWFVYLLVKMKAGFFQQKIDETLVKKAKGC